MSNFQIRTANINDINIINDLILGIAAYEKLSHEVKMTPEDLKKNLFGENPAAKVIIGEENNNPIGFALYFKNFSTFLGRPGIHLEDLFVLPEHRGKGYGLQLFNHIKEIMKKNNYGRFEWTVLKWNTPAIDFYKAQGATEMNEWVNYRIEND
ncbi:MAG: GNAT family N-acetyltransferase [Bdellovibrionales bacterium]|nr:GNAT family N-acetyltransferase [Bdellovibrionales bacterium]